MRFPGRCLALKVVVVAAAVAAERPGLDRLVIRHLIETDPAAASVLGAELFRHEFTTREGAGGATRGPQMLAGHAQACIVCHNVPFGSAGAGATIGRSGPSGRNTPHLFGAGTLEQLGEVITRSLMHRADRNHDGMIDRSEAHGAALVDPDGAGPEPAIDFGNFSPAPDTDRPQLDPSLRIWYVDAAGRRLPAARGLGDAGVAGYRLFHGAFGWSADDGEDPRATASLRTFIVGAFAIHAGIEADDPGLREDAGSGLGPWTPTGSRPLIAGSPPDPGLHRDQAGRSLDDPDGDGVMAELAAAEVDVVEAYLFHHPEPSARTNLPGFAQGRSGFARFGCTACHVPDWQVEGTPDRRGWTPSLQAIGLFSDLRHHDLGPAFHQPRFAGGITLRFRTPPLWGVGSTAPYGHDGASLDLDAVIRRHGGEAAASASLYAGTVPAEREAILAFLRGLVLIAPSR